MDNLVGTTMARHTCLAEMGVGVAGEEGYERVHEKLKVKSLFWFNNQVFCQNQKRTKKLAATVDHTQIVVPVADIGHELLQDVDSQMSQRLEHDPRQTESLKGKRMPKANEF